MEWNAFHLNERYIEDTMAQKSITIVIKGQEGSGRTQIAEMLKQFMVEKGFENLHVQTHGGVDLFVATPEASSILQQHMDIIEVQTS